MNLKLIAITTLLTIVGFLHADDHIEISGMEGLQCKFAEGKDMDDVMKVIDEWNDFGDKNFNAPYSAWIFTPLYRSETDFDFDFMFLGFAESLKDIGIVQDDFQAGASKIFAKWQKATVCSGQSMNFNVEVRSPKNPWEAGGTNYASIQSCTFKDGKSGEDLTANDKIWMKYLDEGGFEGGVWRWWPETGSATSFNHDYWLVASFSSVQEYGAARDNRLTAMLNDSRPEEIHDCDTPRLYQSTNIRLTLPAEE
tara:strand:+ start:1515 stop:2273 length:759 start_codon:yes stop_codon:yes gene_type:complete